MFDSQGWQDVPDATLCIGCSLMAVDNVLFKPMTMQLVFVANSNILV
jgi:hypothetical protein